MVKKGYKQTEVGMIPEDWECVKIKDVATISMCKRIFANQTSTIGDVPFYKIGTFGKEADAYISSKLYVEYRNKYSFPQKGDILISAAGTLGRTVVYDGEKAYFQDSNIVWLDINKTRLCNEYLNQYYKVIKWASSEGSTIARLYNGIIYATYISLPPLPEQQRIAEALSDVDGMISSLEKLIAKYKSIKTACLQQMFPQNGETVPRMRLPGFTGAWEQRKLSEMCGTFEYGLNAAAKEFDGKNKYIRITDIDDASREFLLSDLSSPDICLDGMSKYLLSSGDIVFARTGASVGKTYIYRENDGIVYFAGFLIRAKVNQDNDAEFVFQSTLSPSYEKYIRITSQRSGQPGVNAQEYSEYDLFAPSKEEQQRIGHFLRGIDNLITLHQRKLEKIQKIKQGMMQQLLTGKIRLV